MQTQPVSKKSLWIGWIMTVLPALMLMMSAVMKFARPAPVMEGFAKFGIPEGLVIPLGILELVCTIIYLIPRTAVLGAILLTGYLGGAICTSLRVGDAFIPAVILGVVIWGGIFLREPGLRPLIPLRRKPI